MAVLEPLAVVARNPITSNLAARVSALLGVAGATLLIARAGGPSAVGDYALLRMLPWLLGVLLSGGLPGAVPYFLATRNNGHDPRLRGTIAAMALVAGSLAATVWLAASPAIAGLLLRDLPVSLVALAGCTAFTQLLSVTAKACAQGTADLRGSNLIILLEEVGFLPAYGALLLAGTDQPTALILGLVMASALSASLGSARLGSRGFFAGLKPPSVVLAAQVFWYGLRGCAGTVMTLINLRLDFAILGLLQGPAVVGIYAVASKYAEFLRMLPVALNWVLYPRYAAEGQAAAERASRMLPRAAAITAAAAAPLALAAPIVFPLAYGSEFSTALLPAEIILLGLMWEGVTGVISAFLLASGRPALNSLAMGAGVACTIALDLLLIPHWAVVGAAAASAVAYLVTMLTLLAMFRKVGLKPDQPLIAGISTIPPSSWRRALDVVVASTLLTLLSPLMVALAICARRSTGGSAVFRQPRVGQGGRAFTLYKFRSMRQAAGPEITVPGDTRITRFGNFLRTTSLDELPQLLNVLRGDMTLVGPRPESVTLARLYPTHCVGIFAFRPGLTGPVQVHRRDDVPSDLADPERYYLDSLVPERVSLDMSFLREPTLSSTLWLLVMTGLHVTRRAWRRVS